MVSPVTDPRLLAQLNAPDGPAPVTDPALLAQLDAPEAPAAPAPTLGQSAARQGGLLTRALASAAASPFTTLGDAANKFINGAGQLVGANPNLQMPSAMLQRSLTAAGMPTPETGIEKFTQGFGEGAVGAALPGGLLPQVVGSAAIGGAQAAPGAEGSGMGWGAAAGLAPAALKKTLQKLGSAGAEVLGLTTGAGAESVKQAAKGAPGFVENMRGAVDPGDTVAAAREGVANMRQKMYDHYRTAKGGWGADQTPLDFNGVAKAFADASNKYSFKGTPQPGVVEVQNKVSTLVSDWMDNAARDPSYLTVEGMDALKRHMADIVPTELNNKTGRAFVTEVVNGLKKTITDQRPEYAAAMKEYWNRSNQLDEIERSLSLGDRATVDTALRKLQSVVRNNVNTNFGQRLKLTSQLASEGGVDVLPAVAGQAMSAGMPRGLQGSVAAGGGMASVLNPSLALTLPLFSPRAVGETLHAGGKVARKLAPPASFAETLRRAAPAGLRAFQYENQE